MEIPDGGKPTVTSGDLATVVHRFRDIEREQLGTIVYFFLGHRAPITVPPYRYLLWPDGETRTPLFHIPDEADILMDVDEASEVGQPDYPEPPELVATPAAEEELEEGHLSEEDELPWSDEADDDLDEEPDQGD